MRQLPSLTCQSNRVKVTTPGPEARAPSLPPKMHPFNVRPNKSSIGSQLSFLPDGGIPTSTQVP